MERYSATRIDLGIYLNVTLTARYNCSDKLAVKPALFYALAALIAKHPILSAIPWAMNTKEPYFIRLTKIDLKQAVRFVEDEFRTENTDWREFVDKVLEKEHNTTFESRNDADLPF